MGLVAHVDTRHVPRNKVMAVETPDRTDTWGVIGHGQLIETLEQAVDSVGYEVAKERYSLSHDGARLFGVFELKGPNKDDIAQMIGFRNSINKTLSVGVTAGMRVFVCDNLAFDGEFIRFRKHTGGLNQEELELLAEDAVGKIGDKLKAFRTWHQGLDHYQLTRTDQEALFIRALDRGLVGHPRTFYELYFKKNNKDNDAEYGDTLQGFHGAATQMWKRNSLIGVGRANRELNALLNQAKQELDKHEVLRNG